MEEENIQQPEYVTFDFEEGEYQTTFTSKFRNRKSYVPPDPKKVFAFIPGTIIKIFVKEKHKVKKGEPLIVFQAMKMNNILHAPMNGVIKKINFKVGDTFPKSEVLIEFK
jgi:biotin carboxyl carrier protein